MKIKVVRTMDAALIRSIVTEPAAFASRAEDGYVVDDVQVVIDPLIHWLLLVTEDEGGARQVRGVAIGTPLSKSVLDFHIIILPEFWRQAVNIDLARLAVKYLLTHTGKAKVNATVPVSSQSVIRFLQRVGFKREGLNRASFRHKGELVDQCYLGFTQASLGE